MLNRISIYKNAHILEVGLLTGVKKKARNIYRIKAAYQVPDGSFICSRKEGSSEAAAASELSAE